MEFNMGNQFGRNLRLSIFGESHQPYVGICADGFPAGIEIDEKLMEEMLERRRANSALTTSRHEADKPQIISGVFNGHTTGTPLTILFENRDIRSSDYQKNILRPSQTDFVAWEKYNGFQDYRGSGHFSGRLTVGITAIGSICRQLLEAHGIYVGTHVVSCLDYKEDSFDLNKMKEQIAKLNNGGLPVLGDAEKLTGLILEAREKQDSVGAVMETAVIGLPSGLGEPYFDSLESQLSHGLFSIGGIKGVSFGTGFEMASHYGSEINDPWTINEGRITAATNNDGGINGGISNAMPVVINTVFRPTASIGVKQNTVDYLSKKETQLQLQGRHDPAIFVRGCVVIDSMVSIVLVDNLLGIYGQNWAK